MLDGAIAWAKGEPVRVDGASAGSRAGGRPGGPVA